MVTAVVQGVAFALEIGQSTWNKGHTGGTGDGLEAQPLAAPDWANRVDRPSCVSCRTLMPHPFAARQAEKLSTVRARENNTRGGSSETELNELTVVP